MSGTYFEIVKFVLETKKYFLIWCSQENGGEIRIRRLKFE